MEKENEELSKHSLNLAKETLNEVQVRAKTYQRKAEKRYNNRDKLRNFKACDSVWRKMWRSLERC